MNASKTTFEYNRIADQKRIKFIGDTLCNALPKGAKVLDVGCGNGVISRYLGSIGFHVVGIDISEKTIETAKAQTTLPNVTFLKLSAEELVASGEKYDAVICSEVLEHLENPGTLLSVLYTSLTEKGKLIVTVPNGKGPRELFVTRPVQNLRNRQSWLWNIVLSVKKIFGYKGVTVQSAADNLDHIQFFSKKDLELLSQKHNFRIIKFGKANFVEDVFPFSFVTKKVTLLQKIDCKIADLLPYQFTGGFFTVWEKA